MPPDEHPLANGAGPREQERGELIFRIAGKSMGLLIQFRGSAVG